MTTGDSQDQGTNRELRADALGADSKNLPTIRNGRWGLCATHWHLGTGGGKDSIGLYALRDMEVIVHPTLTLGGGEQKLGQAGMAGYLQL